jgi:hypothetical protein
VGVCPRSSSRAGKAPAKEERLAADAKLGRQGMASIACRAFARRRGLDEHRGVFTMNGSKVALTGLLSLLLVVSPALASQPRERRPRDVVRRVEMGREDAV